MNRRAAEVLWWAVTLAVVAGIYLGLDRSAWFDGMSQVGQSGVRILCGALVIAASGLLSPWPSPRGGAAGSSSADTS